MTCVEERVWFGSGAVFVGVRVACIGISGAAVQVTRAVMETVPGVASAGKPQRGCERWRHQRSRGCWGNEWGPRAGPKMAVGGAASGGSICAGLGALHCY